MLRHVCGYALANKGHGTRAIQGWLGHWSITSTAVYTALAPNRFKDFWRDGERVRVMPAISAFTQSELIPHSESLIRFSGILPTRVKWFRLMQVPEGACLAMHDNSTGGDDAAATEGGSVDTGGLSAADYVRLAGECFLLATLAKDPEKAAELVKTGDDYLRRAAKWLADRIKDH